MKENTQPTGDKIPFAGNKKVQNNLLALATAALATMPLGEALAATTYSPEMPQQPFPTLIADTVQLSGQQPAIEATSKRLLTVTDFMNDASRILSRLTGRENATSAPLEVVGDAILSEHEAFEVFNTSFSDDPDNSEPFIFDTTAPNYQHYLKTELDNKVQDGVVTQEELAAYLKDADQSFFGDHPVARREFNDGMVSGYDLTAHVGDARISYFTDLINNTEGIDPAIRQKALENLQQGTFSAMYTNLTRTPYEDGYQKGVTMKNLLEVHDILTETLGQENGTAFFIRQLAEGDIGEISLDPDTNNYEYIEDKLVGVEERDNTLVYSYDITMETYTPDNLDVPISTQPFGSGAVDITAPLDDLIGLPDYVQEDINKIKTNVLTPDVVQNLYDSVDFNNLEALSGQVRDIIFKTANEIALTGPVEINIGMGDGEVKGSAGIDENNQRVIEIYLNGFQTDDLLRTGNSEEEVKKYFVSMLCDMITHESTHIKQQEFELGLRPTDGLTEQDSIAINQLLSHPPIDDMESIRLYGNFGAYTETPTETVAYNTGDLIRDYVKSLIR